LVNIHISSKKDIKKWIDFKVRLQETPYFHVGKSVVSGIVSFSPHQSIEDFHVRAVRALRILSFNTSKTGSETTGTGGNSLLAGQFFN
jgi:hypothetical protein